MQPKTEHPQLVYNSTWKKYAHSITEAVSTEHMILSGTSSDTFFEYLRPD